MSETTLVLLKPDCMSKKVAGQVITRFEEAGLDDDNAVKETGRRFRDTILAEGGSRHPMDVFRDFRGREPDIQPLLRHNGLQTGTNA